MSHARGAADMEALIEGLAAAGGAGFGMGSFAPRSGGGASNADSGSNSGGFYSDGTYRNTLKLNGVDVLVAGKVNIEVDSAGVRTLVMRDLSVFGRGQVGPGIRALAEGVKMVVAEAAVVHNVQYVVFEGTRMHNGYRQGGSKYDIHGNRVGGRR